MGGQKIYKYPRNHVHFHWIIILTSSSTKSKRKPYRLSKASESVQTHSVLHNACTDEMHGRGVNTIHLISYMQHKKLFVGALSTSASGSCAEPVRTERMSLQQYKPRNKVLNDWWLNDGHVSPTSLLCIACELSKKQLTRRRNFPSHQACITCTIVKRDQKICTLLDITTIKKWGDPTWYVSGSDALFARSSKTTRRVMGPIHGVGRLWMIHHCPCWLAGDVRYVRWRQRNNTSMPSSFNDHAWNPRKWWKWYWINPWRQIHYISLSLYPITTSLWKREKIISLLMHMNFSR